MATSKPRRIFDLWVGTVAAVAIVPYAGLLYLWLALYLVPSVFVLAALARLAPTLRTKPTKAFRALSVLGLVTHAPVLGAILLYTAYLVGVAAVCCLPVCLGVPVRANVARLLREAKAFPLPTALVAWDYGLRNLMKQLEQRSLAGVAEVWVGLPFALVAMPASKCVLGLSRRSPVLVRPALQELWAGFQTAKGQALLLKACRVLADGAPPRDRPSSPRPAGASPSSEAVSPDRARLRAEMKQLAHARSGGTPDKAVGASPRPKREPNGNKAKGEDKGRKGKGKGDRRRGKGKGEGKGQ